MTVGNHNDQHFNNRINMAAAPSTLVILSPFFSYTLANGTVDDMISLPELNEGSILTNLKQRYAGQLIYVPSPLTFLVMVVDVHWVHFGGVEPVSIASYLRSRTKT